MKNAAAVVRTEDSEDTHRLFRISLRLRPDASSLYYSRVKWPSLKKLVATTETIGYRMNRAIPASTRVRISLSPSSAHAYLPCLLFSVRGFMIFPFPSGSQWCEKGGYFTRPVLCRIISHPFHRPWRPISPEALLSGFRITVRPDRSAFLCPPFRWLPEWLRRRGP